MNPAVPVMRNFKVRDFCGFIGINERNLGRTLCLLCQGVKGYEGRNASCQRDHHLVLRQDYIRAFMVDDANETDVWPGAGWQMDDSRRPDQWASDAGWHEQVQWKGGPPRSGILHPEGYPGS